MPRVLRDQIGQVIGALNHSRAMNVSEFIPRVVCVRHALEPEIGRRDLKSY